jgi:glycosyltransferase involved in cell wall biosynthesis
LKEKRVHLLIEALKNINHEIYWFHIGDGPLKVVLERRALDLPNNIKYKFLGFMKNKKVKEFYTNNSIDLFINVSESEGLPVSIMEAFSSGVPVIATDVGGTAELVDDEVGRLIPKDFKIEVLVRIIKQFVIGEIAIPREVVYNRWSKSVNANKNYTDFAQKLLEI